MIDLLILQPTTFCNLDCKYCYLPDRRNKLKMSISTFEKILEKVFKSKHLGETLTILYHSGEPMSVPMSFYEEASKLVYQYEKKTKVKIQQSILTNGTLLNDKWCELFKANNFGVGVSIDGPDFLNDLNRVTVNGKSTFSKVVRGMNFLKKHNMNFYTISVITAQSLNYAEEIYQFFIDHKISKAAFNVEEQEGINTHSSISKDTKSQYKKFLSKFFDLWFEGGRQFQVRDFTPFENYPRIKALDGNQENEPLRIVSIGVNGEISTYSPELLPMKSDTYGDFVFGNINNMELDDIVQTDKFIKMNKSIKDGVAKCKESCKYYRFCGGGSPSIKYSENKALDCTETNFCSINVKARFDVIFDKVMETW